MTRINLADVPQLADQLSISQRMRRLLKGGTMSVAAIANELGEKPNSATQAANRGKGKVFTIVLDEHGTQRIALLEREAS